MTSRSGRRRVDHSSPLVDLDDVFADDALIDAIAAGPWRADGASAVPESGGPFDTGAVLTAEPLTELFSLWREELAHQPFPDPPVVPKAADVVGRAKPPKRSHRPAMAIAAAIAALLVGSTFVGSRQASEDSALWNVTAVLWPDRVESVASRDKVRSALAVAETAISEGRPEDAQAVLLDASFEIGKVDDVDGRQDLQSSLEGLWKKAAPADTSSGSDRQQLVAGGSSSSATRPATTTAAQQAAVEQPAPVIAPVIPPPATTQVAVADLAGLDPGTAGPPPSVGGSVSGSGGNPSVAVAIAAKPSTPGNALESESGEPSSAASTPPVITVEPSTDAPTEQSPTGGSTEPAVAPTPTEPTP
ncbi:MAG: hypothetical protein ABWZ98_11340, partial [Nakamurella sp.]